MRYAGKRIVVVRFISEEALTAHYKSTRRRGHISSHSAIGAGFYPGPVRCFRHSSPIRLLDPGDGGLAVTVNAVGIVIHRDFACAYLPGWLAGSFVLSPGTVAGLLPER